MRKAEIDEEILFNHSKSEFVNEDDEEENEKKKKKKKKEKQLFLSLSFAMTMDLCVSINEICSYSSVLFLFFFIFVIFLRCFFSFALLSAWILSINHVKKRCVPSTDRCSYCLKFFFNERRKTNDKHQYEHECTHL